MQLMCSELMSLNLKFGERHMILCFCIQNSLEALNSVHNGEAPYYLDSVSVNQQARVRSQFIQVSITDRI
jgi:hypothetical protein